jgi:AcrR family transcriptional regulator
MARPVKHDHATRDALLVAAEDLLARGGPDAVSVRAVAQLTGVSTRAVYSVYGSKGALIEALAALGFGYLADLVESVPRTDDPFADLVRAGVDGFRTFAIGRPHLFRLTFDHIGADIFRQPDVDPELQRALTALVAHISRAWATGQLSPRPLVEIAFMFHAFCHGLATNELARMPPPIGPGFWSMTADMDIVQVWHHALDAFVRGLRV